MGMNATWDDLLAMRNKGCVPDRPLIVTTDPRVGYAPEAKGSMVIIHKPHTPMPVQLLAGLDVILVFDRCELAGKVLKLIRQKETTPPKSMTAWCECNQELDCMACACKDKIEIDAMFEKMPSRIYL